MKTNSNLKVALLEKFVNPNSAGINKVIKDLEYILKKESDVDLVLTPEFSFMEYESPLNLNKVGEEFSVVDGSKSAEIIQAAQELAKTYHSGIVLATFYEELPRIQMDKIRAANTLVFIGKDGNISGVKRKYLLPEGNFTVIGRNNKVYRLLPLICADVNQMRNDIPKDEQFDILLHPAYANLESLRRYSDFLNGSDMSFHYTKTIASPKNFDDEKISAQALFNEQYAKWFKNLSKNKHILLSDGTHGAAGAFSLVENSCGELTAGKVKKYEKKELVRNGKYIIAEL